MKHINDSEVKERKYENETIDKSTCTCNVHRVE